MTADMGVFSKIDYGTEIRRSAWIEREGPILNRMIGRSFYDLHPVRVDEELATVENHARLSFVEDLHMLVMDRHAHTP